MKIVNKFYNSQFWLAKSSAIFSNYSAKKMKYSANFIDYFGFLICSKYETITNGYKIQQFPAEIIQKKEKHLGIFRSDCIFFSCILLINNGMVSRAIWKNIHSWVFQRLQIALVLRTRAILTVFENLTRACFFETILLSI
jgi:hypothetical protein